MVKGRLRDCRRFLRDEIDTMTLSDLQERSLLAPVSDPDSRLCSRSVFAYRLSLGQKCKKPLLCLAKPENLRTNDENANLGTTFFAPSATNSERSPSVGLLFGAFGEHFTKP